MTNDDAERYFNEFHSEPDRVYRADSALMLLRWLAEGGELTLAMRVSVAPHADLINACVEILDEMIAQVDTVDH